jgi:hypothetical protein
MVDTTVEACATAPWLSHDNIVNMEHKCAYCSKLERKLRDVLEELSLTQLILNLLQEEAAQNKLCNSCRSAYHSTDYPPEEKSINICNKGAKVIHNHHRLLDKCDNKEDSLQIN